ncbi:ataxin-3-like [Macrobrachium rosenbergii]|uniref:ataxin-3-like n=1 Tax=Macrobrachium rosenbergii TaxID=79674 RepID=UPI0034D6F02C
MELVYHEKQDGLLCGQHCLNNLLQGQYFTAVDLADIAQQMDQAEQQHMAELGMHTDDFRRFMEQPSVNMDDSGMFSIQVLTSALRVWDLTLIPFASSHALAKAARGNPTDQQAYVCNFKEHWFTVRKLGYQWFNLNSLLSFPELISDTYLSLFLTQLQHEGYSIFLVEGRLPESEADQTLRIQPAVQTVKPKLLPELAEEAKSNQEEKDLKAALANSLANVAASSRHQAPDGDDLAAAINLSLQYSDSPDKPGDSEESDLQRAIQLSMSSEGHNSGGPSTSKEELSEDDQLQAALRMSLDQKTPEEEAPSPDKEPDLQEIREKRLAFLSKKSP